MCLKSSVSRAQLHLTNISWVTWIEQSFYYAAVKNKKPSVVFSWAWRECEPTQKSLLIIMSEQLLGQGRGSFVWKREDVLITAHAKTFQLCFDHFMSQLEVHVDGWCVRGANWPIRVRKIFLGASFQDWVCLTSLST